MLNEDAFNSGHSIDQGNDPSAERIGAPLFAAQWPNGRAFWIGVYAGQGLTSPAICARLGEGVQPSTVSGMLSQWGYKLPPGLPRSFGPVTLHLCAKDRTRLDAEARSRGLDMPALCERLLSIAARDHLFAAVLDG